MLSQNNIEFLGSLPRQEVVKNLSKAKALIFPGVEDFGIVPLESMASGTPVIAYREGGVLETLNENTSEFFSSPEEKSLNQAIDRFEKRDFFHGDLVQRANDFSKETSATARIWSTMASKVYCFNSSGHGLLP